MKSLRSKLILGSLAAALGVFHSGVAAASFDAFGKDIPVESAAKQIVPPGYAVEYGRGVDKDTKITWSAAADWQGALSSALARKGLKAEIGKDTVTIVKAETAARPYSSSPSSDMVQRKTRTDRRAREKVESRPAEPRVEREPAPNANADASIGTGGFTIRPYRTATATKSGEVLKGKDIVKDGSWQKYDSGSKGKFVVESGYMLHSTLNAWAEATGWTVAWHSDHDYQIEAAATFEGDFVQATSELIRAMRDARPSITVDYYKGNNVIVISNKLSDEVNH
jgi:hypothetical protein